MFALSIERAHMRPKEFVRRADQEIAVELSDVRESMRGKVHRVYKCHCAGSMGQARDLSNRIDGSHRVGRIAQGHEPCSVAQFVFQVHQVERAVLLANILRSRVNAWT